MEWDIAYFPIWSAATTRQAMIKTDTVISFLDLPAQSAGMPLSYHRHRKKTTKTHKKPLCITHSGLYVYSLLFSSDSACRTNGFASTAIDASIAYNILRFAFSNSAGRASCFTSTAFYAFIGNYMHGIHLRKNITRGFSCPFR